LLLAFAPAADILLGKMARDSEITRVGRGRYALPTVHSGQIEQKERFESQGVELTAEITDLSNLSDPSDGDAEFPGPRPLMGATVPPTAPAEAKSNGRAPPLGPPGDSLDDPMAVIVPGASVGIDILLRTSMEGRLDLRRRSYA
jgi:hypothetical protein